SDRPQIRSLFDPKSTHGSMQYLPLWGETYWSRQRRFTYSYLTEATNNRCYGVMNFEVKRFLHNLLQKPDNIASWLEDMASKIMCTLTWDDASVSAMYTQSAWGLLTQMLPAGPIINLLTSLWDLPMWCNPWKSVERVRHDKQQAMWWKGANTGWLAKATDTQILYPGNTSLEAQYSGWCGARS
ncbi:hypothetical protein B0J14DRAFT_471394, partial [Halenospora varia]